MKCSFGAKRVEYEFEYEYIYGTKDKFINTLIEIFINTIFQFNAIFIIKQFNVMFICIHLVASGINCIESYLKISLKVKFP